MWDESQLAHDGEAERQEVWAPGVVLSSRMDL